MIISLPTHCPASDGVQRGHAQSLQGYERDTRVCHARSSNGHPPLQSFRGFLLLRGKTVRKESPRLSKCFGERACVCARSLVPIIFDEDMACCTLLQPVVIERSFCYFLLPSPSATS